MPHFINTDHPRDRGHSPTSVPHAGAGKGQTRSRHTRKVQTYQRKKKKQILKINLVRSKLVQNIPPKISFITLKLYSFLEMF